jgi:hypothetical protein
MNFTEHVEYIRQTFFPRWDRQRRWQIVQVDDLDGAQGRCDRGSRTISILGSMTGDELLALLIHEIVHAVRNDYHGEAWLQGMEEAASRSDQNGAAGLAGVLRHQIADYRDGFRVTATMLYGEIENCVIDQPQITFPQVVDFLRRDYGFSRDQFLRRFRRAKRVFKEAKQVARETAVAKARSLESMGMTLSASA